MATAFITCSRCERHAVGESHPEQPARLDAIASALRDRGVWTQLSHVDAAAVTREQLERVHDPAYLDEIERVEPAKGVVYLDGDTVMNRDSLAAARDAAGAVVVATDAVLGGRVRNAFCNVRPPGHHAEHDRAMGFCIFNNVAVGVAHAVGYHRLWRVAVVDFDVHHGNGTEDIFQNREEVLLCSTFQHPFYPYSAAHSPTDNVVKVPLAAGTGSDMFRQRVTDVILPALRVFRPQVVFFSAGFDAHRDDPLANLCLTEDDYAWITRAVMDVTAQWSHGRVVSTLEGGYDLRALGSAAAAHIGVLLEAGASRAIDPTINK